MVEAAGISSGGITATAIGGDRGQNSAAFPRIEGAGSGDAETQSADQLTGGSLILSKVRQNHSDDAVTDREYRRCADRAIGRGSVASCRDNAGIGLAGREQPHRRDGCENFCSFHFFYRF